MTDADVLSISGLTKSYDRKTALRGVSLRVARGQVFGLLGPNGSGKTTTLGIVLGATRAGGGSFSWFGRGAGAVERRRIGALLEQPAFYPWLSGRANLAVVAAVKRLPETAIDEPLRTVGLFDARDKHFEAYSLGMKQRLGIAAALMGAPEVLVLDEPTNGVDAQGIFEIREIISAFAKRGGTVILASHILDEVEKVCSHVAILKNGSILQTSELGAVRATTGWIEVGAQDLDGLAIKLGEVALGTRIERRDAMLCLHGASLTAEELNARLAARGVYVNHLVRRQASLESQYLALVGSESPT